MREFFRGWRRKVGCVALGLACAVFVIWMRAAVDRRWNTATVANPVVRVHALWEPTEAHDAAGTHFPGLSGQIYFLTKFSTPVFTDGDVQICLFDDVGAATRPTTPFYTYEFDAAARSHRRFNGTMGPNYFVFIPYPRQILSDTECPVQIRITTGKGSPVLSDLQSVLLASDGNTGCPDTATMDYFKAMTTNTSFDYLTLLPWVNFPLTFLSTYLILWKPQKRG